MITVNQIRQHLIDLLDSGSEAALDEFDEWFARASWNMHQDSDLVASEFVGAIELRLAEFDSGHLDDSEVRKELSSLLKHYSVNISLEPVTVRSGSSSSFSSPQAWALSTSGMSPLMASESPIPH